MSAMTEVVTLRLPLLRRGGQNQDVRRVQRLQHMLNTSVLAGAEKGSEPEWLIDVTGGFGEKTEDAVKLLQNMQGLEEDGKVGKETWTALLAYWLSGDTPS